MKFIQNKTGGQETDEAALLEEYRQHGDLQILGRLYGGYMPLVFGLCLKYFRDEEKSKDAVMQIFEELVSKLRVHQVVNFKSWLYTLARNHCLMQLRKDTRQEFVPIEENFMETDGNVHLDIEDSHEQKLSVMEECMKQLPDEQRDTIDMFYLQKKCYKDISDITGYDMNKVKSYIQNGKRNLKICIEKNSEK